MIETKDSYTRSDINKMKAMVLEHAFQINYFGYTEEVMKKARKFFETFTMCVSGFNLDCTDRRYVSEITAYIPLSKNTEVLSSEYSLPAFKRITVHRRCPVDVDDMVKELKKLVLDHYWYKLKEKEERQMLKINNKVKMSAVSFTHKYLKDKFGIEHSFYYNDTRKTQYMLYKLPFTDHKKGILYEDECKKFAKEFEKALKELKEKYHITNYNVKMPSGGYIIRSCWSMCTIGPDIIVDKTTGEGVPEY